MSDDLALPDFDALAAGGGWSREDWRDAWGALGRPSAWPLVVDLVDSAHHHPIAAAPGAERPDERLPARGP